MSCFIEGMLAKILAEFEMALEREVLQPLNKLSEVVFISLFPQLLFSLLFTWSSDGSHTSFTFLTLLHDYCMHQEHRLFLTNGQELQWLTSPIPISPRRSCPSSWNTKRTFRNIFWIGTPSRAGTEQGLKEDGVGLGWASISLVTKGGEWGNPLPESQK